MRPKSKNAFASSERVPLAKLKLNFSRYVREVQLNGRIITVTQHGRDSAILAPVPGAATQRLRPAIREPIDARSLGALDLRPPRGRGASSKAIQRAIDQERGE